MCSSDLSVKSFSLNIGAVRLSECFIDHDPIDDTEYSHLISHIHHEIETIAEKFTDVSLLIGVGGTATSLAAISQDLEEYERERVHGYQLTQSQIAEILERLKSLSLEDRRRVKGLQPERADVILAGIAIFLVAMECFKVDKLLVSDSDILQGIIYSSAFIR